MIKRFFAFIVLGFFITFKCLTWIPTAAASGVPAVDALEYAIIQTIGMAAQNGAEMDFTDSLADIIHDVNIGTYSVEYGIKTFLRRFAEKAWDSANILYENLNTNNSLDYLAIALSNSSGLAPLNIIELNKKFQQKAIDNDFEVTVPVKDSMLAYFNRFRSNYMQEFENKMNALPEDAPIENPDQDFLDEIDFINGSTFDTFLDSSKILNDGNGRPSMLFFNNGMSFYTSLPNYSNGIFGEILVSDILDINIVSYNNAYAFYKEISFFPNFLIGGTSNYGYLGKRVNNFNVDDRTSYTYWCGWSDSGNASTTVNYNGTLQQVFDYIKLHFHNINIYVDGVLWSSAGSNITSGFNVTIPNAVIDNSTDDGKIVANPIYYPMDQNTGLPIESQYNLDKLYEYLGKIIDGTVDDTVVDYNDLVDAGVIEKTDGSTLTDADIGTKSIADVIADATTDIDDLSITGEISSIIPPLPVLPTFTAGPQGDPTAGFKGMSVLARIINVTNRGLPDDLIDMFYGIVACLIVLGLIKVLHK